MSEMLKQYIQELHTITLRGDAREESYYTALERLLNEYAEDIGRKHVEITTLPKKTEAGNPDFRVWDGRQSIVGYIEAKAPFVDNLDLIEETEQLKRYKQTFPNMILTNFLEFRLYRHAELIEKVLIGRPLFLNKVKTTPPAEKESEFLTLLDKFFSFTFPKVYDARTLAVELAKRTRFLKDEVIQVELNREEESCEGHLFGFYEAFKKYLIYGLSKEEFADLYSQTITYGLFVSRTRSENGFKRKDAFDNIPKTIGILRDIFRFISFGDIPKSMEWIIDDISEVLAETDVKQMLHHYFHDGRGNDPIIHFYETFLSEYDPKTREKRGVYYTPEPVVSYIVQSLHGILKKYFNQTEGLASDRVTVLDPASGTLTFLAETAKVAINEYTRQFGEGGQKKFISNHLLENLYAFEIMMAPYAIGHLKMGLLLEEIGYHLKEGDRFKLYLTNALEMIELEKSNLPGMSSLSEESKLAGVVKRKKTILVILGNPPYSGHSANASEKLCEIGEGVHYITGYRMQESEGRFKLIPETSRATRAIIKHQKTWIGEQIEEYKYLNGNPLNERNSKWLQDDYVKFIRFAQWKIDQTGEGVVGFITNHSYLDNPTFRGMRQSLMQSFNEIYILNLHGNSLKKEKCPDGAKDENVFDIRQGVAIALLIKKKGDNSTCKVFYSERWGLRQDKYDWLSEKELEKTEWNEIEPKPEFYLFVPRNEDLLDSYETYPKITDIFPVNSVGIVTARDELTIKYTPDDVWTTVVAFSKMDPEIARMAYHLGDDTRDWKVDLAQKDLQDTGPEKKRIVPILLKPFDIRYTYYTGKSCGFHCRPRPEVMKHIMMKNLGLIIHKREELSIPYAHFLITDKIVEHCGISPKTTCYVVPLYIYEDSNLFNHTKKNIQEKTANIKLNFLDSLSLTYNQEPTPEEIFFYIYAVFYSTIYRDHYAEFLKIDFPRVPFTKNYDLFIQMSEYGKRLGALHLLESQEMDPPIARMQGNGDEKVEKVKYDEDRECVFINQDQYFDGIPKMVWEYHIGGYQVCNKWLKDRKGKMLSLQEIKQYCRIVTALSKTIGIQAEIDELYPGIEEDTILFSIR